ncbi:MAG: oligosaccharide flippase family protein [Bacteroidetes bacterium]|nr:oligosaccharide flippase family protein [Bacteroidota bacterium]
MSNEQYGILSLFLLYSSIFSHIIGLGVGKGFLFQYWDVYKDEEKLKKLISSTIGLILIIQLIFISIGLLFDEFILSFIQKEDSDYSFRTFYILALFQGAFLIFYEIFCYFYRNQEKLKQYAILNVGALILFTIGSIIGVIFLKMEALGATYGRVIGYGIIIIFFLFYFIKKYGISLDLKISKALLVFSLPLFVNSVIGALGYGIDKIMIERLDTMENLGIYSLALVFVSVLEIWLNSINNALNPTLYRYLNEKIVEKKEEIQGLVYLIITSVMLLITIILALIYPVLELIIPEEYHKVTTFLPILSVAFIWRVFSSIVVNSLYIKKKTKLFLFNEITVLAGVILFGYFGYQFFGIVGIALAVYLVKLIEFILMNHLSRKTMALPFSLYKFYILTFILTTSAFICSLLDKKGIINNYLLFLIPFLSLIITYPLLMKYEIKRIWITIKYRKRIFFD